MILKRLADDDGRSGVFVCGFRLSCVEQWFFIRFVILFSTAPHIAAESVRVRQPRVCVGGGRGGLVTVKYAWRKKFYSVAAQTALEVDNTLE